MLGPPAASAIPLKLREYERGGFDQASTCEPVRRLSANSMATSSFVHTRSITIHSMRDVTHIKSKLIASDLVNTKNYALDVDWSSRNPD
jgi:hypothetical protein